MHTLAVVSCAALLAATVLPAAADDTGGTGKDPVSAAELLAKVKTCDRISTGKYRTDQGGPAKVPVCGTEGAVFWEADMDIDCDGRITKACNSGTDPSFQAQTAFRTSAGKPWTPPVCRTSSCRAPGRSGTTGSRGSAAAGWPP